MTILKMLLPDLADMEESNSRHTSPRIGARKSPLPSEKLKSEPLIPKHPLAVPDSPSQVR